MQVGRAIQCMIVYDSSGEKAVFIVFCREGHLLV